MESLEKSSNPNNALFKNKSNDNDTDESDKIFELNEIDNDNNNNYYLLTDLILINLSEL